MAGNRAGEKWNPVNYEKGMVFRAIDSNGKTFVAVGDANLLWTSTDGINWTVRNPKVGPFHSTFDIAWGDDKFVAVGSKGHIMTSSNGTTGWRHRQTDTTEGLWGVTYANGLWVATGNRGVVLTSPDGIVWTNRGKIAGENLLDVIFGEGLFVAVGSTGGIYISSNGINWKRQQRAIVGMIAGAYGGGNFVIGGRDGVVYSSSDGKNWIKRNTETRYFVQDLIYTGAGFVAVGGYGLAMTSSNGTSWTVRNSRAITSLMGIASNGKALVAAGLARGLVISYYAPDTVKPFVKVQAPNKFLSLEGGDNELIRWSGINVNNVKIEFSSNGGSTYSTVKKSYPNRGICNWTVPDVQSYECLVRVSDASNKAVSDVGDVPFSINIGATVPSSIAITSPVQDQKLTGGSKFNITWKGSKKYDKVDLEYYNGSKWIILASGVPDTGSYEWTVPQLSTSKARLWMKGWSLTGHAVHTFKGYFAIGTSFSVLSPNGGETWTEGETKTIQWRTNGVVGKVNIDYSINGGSSWKSIVKDETNDGSYNWKIPAVDSADCLVRITDTADSKRKDTSNETFKLKKQSAGGVTEHFSMKFKGTIDLSLDPDDASSLDLKFIPD
jgi:hypothetical protein